MKVLYVASANNGDIPTLVRVQGRLLELDTGVFILYFGITGTGFYGYLKNVFNLRSVIKRENIDLIHAHFSFAGVLAILAFSKKPVVVSLLGSDVFNRMSKVKKMALLIVKIMAQTIIVKSDRMNDIVRSQKVVVLPNGVDTLKFNVLDRLECRKKLKWDDKGIHILFGADDTRREKNFQLFKSATELCNEKIVIHVLKNIDHNDIPIWINASDVVVLSSLWEGSPNIIKEGMACNVLILSTDVGDVSRLLNGVKGTRVARGELKDFYSQLSILIQMSLDGITRSDARGRIFDLGLDSKTISTQLLKIYESTFES